MARLSGAEIHHVHISPKSDVVREVPAHMIGVLVDNDGVTIPEPAIDKGIVVREDAEIVAVKPEPLPVPSL